MFIASVSISLIILQYRDSGSYLKSENNYLIGNDLLNLLYCMVILFNPHLERLTNISGVPPEIETI